MAIKFLIVSLSIFAFGCARIYYPALWNSVPPVSTPHVVRENLAVFMSAHYNNSSGFYEGELNNSYHLNLSLAGGGDFYKGSIGGFAYFGNYRQLSYFGFGFSPDVDIFVSLGVVDVGVGASSGIFGEFGDYTNFRRDKGDVLGGFPAEMGGFVFVYNFLQFNFSKNDKLALRVNFGLPGFISANLSFFNIKYGGLWVGSGIGENGNFEIASVGVSLKVK